MSSEFAWVPPNQRPWATYAYNGFRIHDGEEAARRYAHRITRGPVNVKLGVDLYSWQEPDGWVLVDTVRP